MQLPVQLAVHLAVQLVAQLMSSRLEFLCFFFVVHYTIVQIILVATAEMNLRLVRFGEVNCTMKVG